MECERVREEFIERMTGTLDANRASAIDQHLTGCPECRAETERLTEMWRELGQLRIPAPTGAGGRIERLIDARAHSGTAAPSREKRALRFTLIGSLAVAASLAIGNSAAHPRDESIDAHRIERISIRAKHARSPAAARPRGDATTDGGASGGGFDRGSRYCSRVQSVGDAAA